MDCACEWDLWSREIGGFQDGLCRWQAQRQYRKETGKKVSITKTTKGKIKTLRCWGKLRRRWWGVGWLRKGSLFPKISMTHTHKLTDTKMPTDPIRRQKLEEKHAWLYFSSLSLLCLYYPLHIRELEFMVNAIKYIIERKSLCPERLQ